MIGRHNVHIHTQLGDPFLGRIVGHYRIAERLGGGGMGVVYRADDLHLGRTVALKLLPPELTRDEDAKVRFQREAKAASRLDHPNICTIHDFGETEDGQMYLAMACYEGQLLERMVEQGPLPLAEAIRIVEQIARGLGKAHLSGIIHRDIKPGNVILTADGVVKILDFGLAKLMAGTRITRTHTAVGTPVYMAPEQLRGKEVGPQTDIWALGVVFFELLTGNVPFQGDYTEAVMFSILNDPPASVPAEPEADRVIRRMLRKDPLQRYQSVEEVLAALEELRTPGSGSGDRTYRRISPDRLRSGAKLGPYQIVKAIGSGGTGDVYMARDTRLDRPVAIKVLPPDFSADTQRKERFRHEAKTLSQVTHPNICTLFDVGEEEGVDYLVMEYLEGETLAEKRLPLPIPEALRIGMKIAAGLAAAHKSGIVHRALEPANVMLTKMGEVKLLDFGLARDVEAIDVSERSTGSRPPAAEGRNVGRLSYMAPEQLEGKETDPRTDIFALGTILYELITGRRAFEGETRAGLIAAILEREPSPLQPAVPPPLEHVIRKCLAKVRDDRWQSAADVAGEMEWIRGLYTTGSMVLTSPPLPRRRFPLVTALAVAAVLVALAIAGAFRLARRLEVSERLIRAELIPRASQPLAVGALGPIALSPDATRLAMLIGGEWDSFPSSIAVRDLASGETKVLPGTEGATFPFWSADGTQLGFFANQKLKTVGAAGGAVHVICDAPQGRGGSWSSERVIVFAASSWGPILKVADSGGTPVPVTRPPREWTKALPAKEWTHRNPVFLPDGRTFLFIARNHATMPPGDLYAGFIDGREPKLIAEKTSNAAVFGDRLLFVRNGMLVAQPFDQETLTVSGRPADIAQGVESWTPRDIANFSAAGNTIAYVSTVVNSSRIGIFDRTGRQLEQKGEPADYHILDVSRDGKQLAVAIGDYTSTDVWLMQLDGSATSRVTFVKGLEPNARFSPDGKRLAISFFSPPDAKILIRTLDGSTADELVAFGSWSRVTGWSADGNSLVGDVTSQGSGLDIVHFDLRQRKLREIVKTPADETMAALSPDGKWMAYVSTESGAEQVYVTTFPDGRGKWQASIDGGGLPRWSADGRQLYFRATDKLFVTDVGEGGAPRFSPPVALPIRVESTGAINYAPLPDGQLASVVRIGQPVPKAVHLITNWKQP